MVLLGPDLSHNNAAVDFTRVAAEGASFVISKISQGSTFKDPAWPRNRDQARAAGLLLVGYVYVTTDSAAAQAATCASWIGDKSIPVALDWEANGGTWANLLAVLKAFRAAGLNVRLLYTGQWYWAQVGSPDMRGCGLALWKSRYPTTTPGAPAALYARVPATYWAPLGGLDTRLLQFTDHASIAGINCDCSAFQGSRADLAALLGIGPTAPPTPAPSPGEDVMTDADRAMLKDLHDALPMFRDIWAQLAGENAKPGEFTGWPPFPGGTGKPLTLVDYVRTANVQLVALLAALDKKP